MRGKSHRAVLSLTFLHMTLKYLRHKTGAVKKCVKGTLTRWSWRTDLNPQSADYKSATLPIELHQHMDMTDSVYACVLIRLCFCLHIILSDRSLSMLWRWRYEDIFRSFARPVGMSGKIWTFDLTLIESALWPIELPTYIYGFLPCWWTVKDSNLGRIGYEPIALPTELTDHV